MAHLYFKWNENNLYPKFKWTGFSSENVLILFFTYGINHALKSTKFLINSASIKFTKSFIQKHKQPPHHLSEKEKNRKLPKKIILKSHAIRVDSSLLQIPQLYFDLWKHHPTKFLVSPSNNYKYPRARWVGLIWRLSPNSLWDLLKIFPEMLKYM
jgi:hypothetical protein